MSWGKFLLTAALAGALLTGAAANEHSQNASSQNAPSQNGPSFWVDDGASYRALENGIERARATLDDARVRYFGELRNRADFYCAVRLGGGGKVEQVFVKVSAWDDQIRGVIASPVEYANYQRGQTISFDAADVMDWAIKFPNGKIEGNYVGRALQRAAGL
ncbi:hypothetical protein FACS1894139_13610 [Planctomycetales bacterium]|nr:hypothetical protein FACS1894107_07040 [Planctomycetales bacterium]GHT06830.1 hypothetical protein FACS1894139_13610 [Planctomycetales bacterium]GHV18765.1 hypothetical protein AGMMS49959_01470 [Planctomycetales bacterium]